MPYFQGQMATLLKLTYKQRHQEGCVWSRCCCPGRVGPDHAAWQVLQGERGGLPTSAFLLDLGVLLSIFRYWKKIHRKTFAAGLSWIPRLTLSCCGCVKTAILLSKSEFLHQALEQGCSRNSNINCGSSQVSA